MNNLSTLPKDLQDRLEILPSEIRELFQYNTIDVVMEEIAKEFGLNEEKIALLKIEVELILCLFTTRDDLVETIQRELGLQNDQAKTIKQRLQDNLFILVEDILDFIDTESLKNEIKSTVVPNAKALNTVLPAITNDIHENSPALESTTIPTIRTFADDVRKSRAHGYGVFRSEEGEEDTTHKSSQDDIIKK